ncbi:MAG TPA: hypothetical protein P5069_07815 [Candidatus Hydrogenedentes bacterium]|nr:hypothetical protein [Candidatus Hydrogenedentota bacterium]HRZ82357.1 hypothetical protein [Candidatus Hydrogenedentota bacterium]
MKRTLLSLALCCAFLAGCETMPWQSNDDLPPVELLEESQPAPAEPAVSEAAPAAPAESGPSLTMSPNQRFKDVPLPEKAKEDLDRSYIYESPTLQIGRMVYTIRADQNAIAQFYISQCPASGWSLESVQQANGNANLLFKQPGKRLEVMVQPLGMGRGQRLILHMVPDGGV